MRYFSVGIIAFCLLTFGAIAIRADDAPATQPLTLTPVPARKEAFFRKSLVDAYETIGSHNQKWDDNARKIMELAVKRWMLPQPDPDIDWQIMVLGDQAFRAGCDDPAVLYCDLRAHMTLNATFKRGLIVKLDQKMADSKYAPFLKVFAYGHIAEIINRIDKKPNTEVEIRRLLQNVYVNLPGMLAEQDYPQSDTATFCNDIAYIGASIDGDRKLMIDAITEIMVKAEPDSAVADEFQGLAYWTYASDVPGMGSDDVPGSPRNDRHLKAEEFFNRVLAKDPHCAAASAAMVGTLNDEDGDPAKLDKYFHRAITDDPNCYLAYYYRMAFLNNGKPDADANTLAYGRECLATKRWEARIPFLLLESHRHIVENEYSQYLQNADTDVEQQAAKSRAYVAFYAAQPGTWQDVKNLYEGYLAYNPKAVTERINYAKAALAANLPKIAQEQLTHLDNNADPVFKDLIAQPELRAAVRAASDKADAAPNPAP